MTSLVEIWTRFQTNHHCSVDQVLCLPSLRCKFLDVTELSGLCLPEVDVLWGLVSLRKSKQLPRLAVKSRCNLGATIEIIDSNVLMEAWTFFKRENCCSIDRMLCCPKLRRDFCESVQRICGNLREEAILWGVIHLRKTRALSGRSQFGS